MVTASWGGELKISLDSPGIHGFPKSQDDVSPVPWSVLTVHQFVGVEFGVRQFLVSKKIYVGFFFHDSRGMNLNFEEMPGGVLKVFACFFSFFSFFFGTFNFILRLFYMKRLEKKTSIKTKTLSCHGYTAW